ncbi:MAG: hypothetical protein ACE5HO_16675, partial [bacterium]
MANHFIQVLSLFLAWCGTLFWYQPGFAVQTNAACDSTIVIAADSVTIDVVAINFLTKNDSAATIIRIDKTEAEKSKIAACVDIQNPGFYRISALIAYSKPDSVDPQKNESFFLNVFNDNEAVVNPCDPNAGPHSVVVRDVVAGKDTLWRHAGVFLLESGVKTIFIKHYELIAAQYPRLVNDAFEGPESVHLLKLTLVHTNDNYDLALSKKASRQRVEAGEGYAYHLQIRNVGSATAHQIQLQDVLPDSVSPVGFNLSPLDSSRTDTLFWKFDSLAVGDSIDIDYQVRVAESLPPALKRFVNLSQISALCDFNLANNFASDTVLVTRRAYDLKVTKSVTPDTVLKGSVFTYALKILNLGPDEATDLALQDVLPDSVLLVNPPDTTATDTLSWHFA